MSDTLGMESRQHPRFEVDQEVTVTLLGALEITFRGVVVNASGKGLCLRSSQQLAPGAAVKIELTDMLVLGEVVYCRRQGEDHCMGITLDQALDHTRDLAVLAARLLGRTDPLRTYDKEETPL